MQYEVEGSFRMNVEANSEQQAESIVSSHMIAWKMRISQDERLSDIESEIDGVDEVQSEEEI